jgi:hypothetical protein
LKAALRVTDSNAVNDSDSVIRDAATKFKNETLPVLNGVLHGVFDDLKAAYPNFTDEREKEEARFLLDRMGNRTAPTIFDSDGKINMEFDIQDVGGDLDSVSTTKPWGGFTFLDDSAVAGLSYRDVTVEDVHDNLKIISPIAVLDQPPPVPSSASKWRTSPPCRSVGTHIESSEKKAPFDLMAWFRSSDFLSLLIPSAYGLTKSARDYFTFAGLSGTASVSADLAWFKASPGLSVSAKVGVNRTPTIRE